MQDAPAEQAADLGQPAAEDHMSPAASNASLEGSVRNPDDPLYHHLLHGNGDDGADDAAAGATAGPQQDEGGATSGYSDWRDHGSD